MRAGALCITVGEAEMMMAAAAFMECFLYTGTVLWASHTRREPGSQSALRSLLSPLAYKKIQALRGTKLTTGQFYPWLWQGPLPRWASPLQWTC